MKGKRITISPREQLILVRILDYIAKKSRAFNDEAEIIIDLGKSELYAMRNRIQPK